MKRLLAVLLLLAPAMCAAQVLMMPGHPAEEVLMGKKKGVVSSSVTFLAYGDSKTYGIGDSNPPADGSNGYPPLLAGMGFTEAAPRIGHLGYRVGTLDTAISADLASWGNIKAPNYFLYNCGVNDLPNTIDSVKWKNFLGWTLDSVHAKWPTTQVRVMRVWRVGDNASISAQMPLMCYSWIPKVLSTRSSWASIGPDEGVFLYNEDNGATYTPGGIHPNHAGYILTATAWANNMNGIIWPTPYPYVTERDSVLASDQTRLGYSYNVYVNTGAQGNCYVGDASGARQESGLEFPLKTNTARIDSCFLLLTPATGTVWASTDTAVVKIYAVDNAVGYTLGGGQNTMSLIYPTVSDSILWPGLTDTVAAGLVQKSPNLARLVQAVVDRQGWSSGHYVGLALFPKTQVSNHAIQFQGTTYNTLGPKIRVNYKTGYYAIAASAGSGGSISPSGDVLVASGANQTFTITPTGVPYVIDTIKVDGSAVGSSSPYTLSNVTANHVVTVTFRDTSVAALAYVSSLAMDSPSWGATSTSGTLNVGTSNNRYVLVWGHNDGGDVVTGFTFDGVAGSSVYTDDAQGLRVYALKAPHSGSHTITVTAGSSIWHYQFGAVSFCGVNQTTPLGTFAKQENAWGTTQTTAVTSVSGDLVTSLAQFYGGWTVTGIGGSETQRFWLTTAQRQLNGTTIPAVGSSTNVSVTIGSNSDLFLYGVAVKH